MPSLSVALINMLGNITGGPSVDTSKGDKDEFSSLLDMIGGEDHENGSDEDAALAQPGRDDRDNTPPAAAIDVPTTLFTASKSGEEEQEAPVEQAAEKPAANNNRTDDVSKPGKENQPTRRVGEKAVDAAPPSAKSADNTPAEPTSAGGKMEKIRQVLTDLLALLGGAQPAAAPGIQLVKLATPEEVASVAAPTATTPNAASSSTLIADVKSMLQQIEALLGQGGETAAVAGEEVPESFTALFEKFKFDFAALLKQAPQKEAAPDDAGTLDLISKQLDSLADMIKPPVLKAQPASMAAEAERAPLELVKMMLAPKEPEKKEAPLTVAADDKAVSPVLQNNTNATTTQTLGATAVAAAAGKDSGTGSSTDQGGSNNNNSQTAPLAGLRATDATKAGAGIQGDFARVLNQVRTPVLEQVTLQIRTAINDGSSRIRIQLDPADLGKLDIKMHVNADGKTNVTITADNKSTLDMLQRDAAGLARALADAGLTADSGNLSFNLKQGEQDAQDLSQAALTYQKAAPDEEEELLNPLTRTYVVNLSEGLDISI